MAFRLVRSFTSYLKSRSGNLPDGYPDKSLRELFERYGEVTECDVLKNFGFVHFRKPEEAEKAKDGLVNHTIEGKKIRVESSGSGRGGSSSAAGTKLFVGRRLCVVDRHNPRYPVLPIFSTRRVPFVPRFFLDPPPFVRPIYPISLPSIDRVFPLPP